MISASFAGISAHRVGLTLARAWLLCALCLCLSACFNPHLDVRVTTNSTGGAVNLSGNGFTPAGQVAFSAVGVPGRSTPLSLGSTTADRNGAFDGYVRQFQFPADPNPLPGCANGSTNAVNVQVTATDTTQSIAAPVVTVAVRNCAWELM